MTAKNLASLLNRAAAALETPDDLTDQERDHVAEELAAAAEEQGRTDELAASLSDAADALDQVTDWMDRIALPVLEDDADGGNSLCEGLKMKAEEIRDLLAKLK